ncbi:MAG: hypothetical protein CME32_23410 [Gimesia sp.]|nr:hypothetical protein [Gimesia sp.]
MRTCAGKTERFPCISFNRIPRWKAGSIRRLMTAKRQLIERIKRDSATEIISAPNSKGEEIFRKFNCAERNRKNVLT